MMKSMIFKQAKPLTVTILGACIMLLTMLLIYESTAELSQVLLMSLLGFGLLGHSISYEIQADLNHTKQINLLGFTMIKSKLDCIIPEYITVFSALFKKGSDWGQVSAMGSHTRERNYVIRFFKGNTHFTVWKTKSLPLEVKRATELGALIDVEVLIKNK